MDEIKVDNGAFFGEVVTLLRKGKTVTVPAKGDSMLPFIEGGRDSVELEGIEAGTPDGQSPVRAEAGDIVLFRTGDRHILHRILRFNGDVAEIQGDGILHAKDHCPRTQIFGRVTAVLKNGTDRKDVNSGPYRLKVRIWLGLSPLRRIILGCRKRIFRRCTSCRRRG